MTNKTERDEGEAVRLSPTGRFHLVAGSWTLCGRYVPHNYTVVWASEQNPASFCRQCINRKSHD